MLLSMTVTLRELTRTASAGVALPQPLAPTQRRGRTAKVGSKGAEIRSTEQGDAAGRRTTITRI